MGVSRTVIIMLLQLFKFSPQLWIYIYIFISCFFIPRSTRTPFSTTLLFSPGENPVILPLKKRYTVIGIARILSKECFRTDISVIGEQRSSNVNVLPPLLHCTELIHWRRSTLEHCVDWDMTPLLVTASLGIMTMWWYLTHSSHRKT